MPARRNTRQHYDVAATITPETGFKVSLTQALMIIGGVFVVAVGYAYLVWGLSTASKTVEEIQKAQTTVITTTAAAVKEQDEKRTALGKQFIDSNEKIAAAVGTLATQMAVQQERQKSTDEKLEKVLTQIGARLDQAPMPPVRSR